ncbi:MAG: Lysyl oxidase-like protein [Conexibacter sp.]|nr:Lysyl oxidase-like protein [Conexibacter sp.]
MPSALLRRAVALCFSVVVAVAVLAPAGRADPPAGARLPDLDQELPSQLDVSVSGAGAHPSYRLGFGSGVRNVGTGPLIIDAHRASTSAPMVGDQLVETDGGEATVPGAGTMRYVRSPDHQHWHLLGFDRYELRRAGGSRALVRDRKTGFCLGDRYRVTTRSVPQTAPQATYTSRCGLTHPELLRVREGISVGYGDFYAAHIEYQDLPLTGLGDGRYVLVHRTNADRRLRESDYGNDAASILLDLRWHNGVPAMKVLANCPDSARCERPGLGLGAAPHASAARVPLARALTVAERSMLCRLSWRS